MTLQQVPASPLVARLSEQREEWTAELERKRAERIELVAAHQAALSTIDGDIELLVNVVAALEGGKTQPKKRRKTMPPRKSATGMGISTDRAKEAVEGIEALLKEKGTKTFTQREMYRFLDWDQSKGSSCVRYLRTIGYLRRAGKKGAADLWAIMDREALNRELASKDVRLEDNAADAA